MVRHVLECSESISDFCNSDRTLGIAQRETCIGNEINRHKR